MKIRKSKNRDFAKVSYSLQEKNMNGYALNKKKAIHSETWFNEDTIDAWRHKRMKSFVDPLLSCHPDTDWLTVGDGRYGTDAHYLMEKGANVVATDISTALLKIGKKRGYIKDFRKENAEKLSFNDGAFDFVFCKESFHHFPRPMIVLYEMLRVAKGGVILIEPHDSISHLESLMVKLLRKANYLSFNKGYFNSFEESGNYVYKVSEREIEKTAIALQLESVAFAGLDDFYVEGVEYKKPGVWSLPFLEINAMLFVLDIFYKLHLRKRSILISIIFKKRPSGILKRALRTKGFKVFNLPKNPYLK